VDKWTLTEIQWIDAHGPTGQENSVAYIAKHKPCLRITQGYWLGEKGEYTFIAGTDDRHSNMDNEDDCAEINGIPTAMIKKISILRRTR
jgi:hypothetical protein